MTAVAAKDLQPAGQPSALEALPHLTAKVVLMWGTRELDTLISGLIMDSRDGQRKGLPMAAAAELLFLAQCNKIVRAIDAAQELKVSLREAYQMVDAGDQGRLATSGWDDPISSRDTARQRQARAEPAVRTTAAKDDGGGLFYWCGRLAFALIRSKWFLALLFFVLSGRVIWTFARVH